MNIEIKDTLTLDDDKSYVVVSKVNYQNNTYLYLIEAENNDDVKILKLEANNKLTEFDNPELIKELLPLFLKESAKYIDFD